MKRAKPKKNSSVKHYISDKQLERAKRDVAKDMTDKVALLMLVAIADEFEDINEDKLAALMKRVDRYTSHIDNHIATMEDVRKSIEKKTGMKLKGWV